MACAGQLKLDLSSKQLKLPPDIREAHDRIQERIHIVQTKKDQAEFDRKTKELYKTYIGWHDKQFAVVLPAGRTDFLREGQQLHHCVGRYDSYYKNHIAGKGIILFIRSVTDTGKPLYTCELDCEKLEIRQFSGANNKRPPQEAWDFMKKYIRVIKKIKKEKGHAA